MSLFDSSFWYVLCGKPWGSHCYHCVYGYCSDRVNGRNLCKTERKCQVSLSLQLTTSPRCTESRYTLHIVALVRCRCRFFWSLLCFGVCAWVFCGCSDALRSIINLFICCQTKISNCMLRCTITNAQLHLISRTANRSGHRHQIWTVIFFRSSVFCSCQAEENAPLISLTYLFIFTLLLQRTVKHFICCTNKCNSLLMQMV